MYDSWQGLEDGAVPKTSQKQRYGTYEFDCYDSSFIETNGSIQPVYTVGEYIPTIRYHIALYT